jgi:hypothetical protein
MLFCSSDRLISISIASNDVSIMKPFEAEITSGDPVSVMLMYPDSISGGESPLPVVLLAS